MIDKLIADIREYRNAHPERSLVNDRLLELVEMIKVEFTGEERKHLLGLVQETFDNLVEIGNNAELARTALDQLKHQQQRLTGLLNFMLMKPATGPVH